MTLQPRSRSILAFRLSRRLLPASFRSQNSRLVFGIVDLGQFLCPCQKQP